MAGMLIGKEFAQRKLNTDNDSTVCLAHLLDGFYLNLPGQQANVV